MARPVHTTYDIERRTYIKGLLQAKYVGFIDNRKSDKSHENFYNIDILEATVEINEIDIIRWQHGGIFEEFVHLELFATKLPDNTDFCIISDSGNKRHFNLTLHDVRIKEPVIADRIIEEERVFGTLTGTICGYFLHYDQGTHIILVEDEAGVPEQNVIFNEESNEQVLPYRRSKDKKVSSLWFKETLQSAVTGLAAVLGLVIAIPLVLYGWPLLIVAGVGYGLSYLSSALPKATRRIASAFNIFLLLIFLFLFLAGAVSYINQGSITPVVDSTNQSIEQSSIIPLPTPLQDSLQVSDLPAKDSFPLPVHDSLIMHYRVWEDYKGEHYSGLLSVRSSDFRASTQYRNQTVRPVMIPPGFEVVFEGLDQFDSLKLVFLYSLFDSLKRANELDRIQFAEMVVSCVQDIPYTLILEHECNPWRYQDAFIRDYLNSGGKCRPYVKYGVLSPVEFIATLDGDCDTRALLLYTVLKHYKYDVTLLVSNYYQHAVLGINLPYRGLAKTIYGRRYVVWETTAKVIPPGVLPPQISNMNLWIPVLLSTQ